MTDAEHSESHHGGELILLVAKFISGMHSSAANSNAEVNSECIDNTFAGFTWTVGIFTTLQIKTAANLTQSACFSLYLSKGGGSGVRLGGESPMEVRIGRWSLPKEFSRTSQEREGTKLGVAKVKSGALSFWRGDVLRLGEPSLTTHKFKLSMMSRNEGERESQP